MKDLKVAAIIFGLWWWLKKRKPAFSVCNYDGNKDGYIELEETYDAVKDVVAGNITEEQMNRVVACYQDRGYCSLY